MSQQPFKKFVVKKNNAAIKEKFKQEKKQAKKARAEAINKRFEEKRALKKQGYSPSAQVPIQSKPDKRQKYPQSGNKKLDIRNKESESRGPQQATGNRHTLRLQKPQTTNPIRPNQPGGYKLQTGKFLFLKCL